MTNDIPIITIIGKSGSGKTTLLEKLIPELKRREYRIATIKHHSHAGFDIDRPGKDSWRHAQAGSDHVIVAAPDKIASYRRLEQELSLDEIAAGVKDVDIILVEGYKRAGKPTLEVIRSEIGLEPICPPEQCFAIAVDTSLPLAIPQFDLGDVMAIADFIEEKFLSSVRYIGLLTL
ncbi:MAG: molybdopterin-guanine dinucleotide biosynthesis protein B [Ardenticatenaceae bacterium]|nr:molybdopterin-guanine dinucleotide biosynthesis protein B [Ardenticatenaceae bacterium]MCB9443476.1 molybdopterin-guanine dinucleotide biosynthesis protein B [Ardenticatenaceae bacterium]